MTDLETRLRESLQTAAAEAPPAAGLAARVRTRRRPRRRLAWTTGVLVAAAVVAVALLPRLVGSTGSEIGVSDAPSGSPTLAGGWQSVLISQGGEDPFEIDLPPGFPDGGIFTYPAGRRDRERPQGEVRVQAATDKAYGRVLVGDLVVFVDVKESPAAVRRILASVRPGGTPGADVTGWETAAVSDSYGEVTALVPDDPRVEVRLLGGFPDCEPGRTPAEPEANGGWTASMCRDRIVTVTAPTQALADVVAATVEGW